MIDNLTILFTTIVTVFIVWRAARMDKVMPWFRAELPNGEQPDPPSRSPRRRGDAQIRPTPALTRARR